MNRLNEGLSKMMKRPNFFIGQQVSAYSPNNNLIEGKLLMHNGKKIVLMESGKWIAYEGLTHVKAVGRNLREALKDFLDKEMTKLDLDGATDVDIGNIGKALKDVAMETLDMEQAAEGDVQEMVTSELLTKKGEDNLDTDPKAIEHEMEKKDEVIENAGVAKEPENDTEEKLIGDPKAEEQLNEYIQKKRNAIREHLKQLHEDSIDSTFGDIFDDEEDEDMSDDFEDELDDDDVERATEEEAKEYIDEEEGHGLAPDNYTKAYEDAVALLKDGLKFRQVSEQLTADYECSPDEADDIVDDAVFDNIDDDTEEEIEDAIDEYEDEAEIYDDDELLEHVCNRLSLADGKKILQETGNVPDTILKIAEKTKLENKRFNLIERAARTIERITEKNTSDEDKSGQIIQLFENRRFKDIIECHKDVERFVNTLYEHSAVANVFAKKTDLKHIIYDTLEEHCR